MLYLGTSTAPSVLEAMKRGIIGRICTPNSATRTKGEAWCADNGAFSARWDADKWWRFLESNVPNLHTCLFAALPDVVGDWSATLERSEPWIDRVKELGYPVAIVLQDGATIESVPWNRIDAVFIGGTTAFKFTPEVAAIVGEAKRRGLWAHMGRVNSGKRFAYAASIGCDSADGTFLSFGPDQNLIRLMRWLDGVDTSEQP